MGRQHITRHRFGILLPVVLSANPICSCQVRRCITRTCYSGTVGSRPITITTITKNTIWSLWSPDLRADQPSGGKIPHPFEGYDRVSVRERIKALEKESPETNSSGGVPEISAIAVVEDILFVFEFEKQPPSNHDFGSDAEESSVVATYLIGEKPWAGSHRC